MAKKKSVPKATKAGAPKPEKPAKSPKASMASNASAAHADGAPGIDIGITRADRSEIADGLARFLSDSFTLYLKTHNFHWNVTGSMFNALHNMFEAQYTEQWNALDDMPSASERWLQRTPGSYAESSS